MNRNDTRKIRVLFVDDSEYVLQSLRRMLWDLEGVCDLAFASDGAQALALLDQRRADILVADLQMPGMSGWGLLDGARRADPALRCFVLAGNPAPEDVARAGRLGYALIEKPCSAEALKAAIFGSEDTGRPQGPAQEREMP